LPLPDELMAAFIPDRSILFDTSCTTIVADVRPVVPHISTIFQTFVPVSFDVHKLEIFGRRVFAL
jgi:hypothetical protein